MIVTGGGAYAGDNPAPGIEIIVVKDCSTLVGENSGGMQMIRDVVLDVRGIGRGLRYVSHQPLPAEENVIGEIAGRIRFSERFSFGAEPVVCDSRAVGLLDAPAIGVIRVRCGIY